MRLVNKVIILALTAAVLLTGCTSGKDQVSENDSSGKAGRTVNIGYVDSGKSFPSDVLGIAADKGYIADELKKVNAEAKFIPFIGAGPAINEALVSKSLDIGDLGDVPSIIAKSNGTETELISVQTAINDAALIVPAGSGITDIKQLKGKRVAAQKGSYMHRTLIKMLSANGLTVNDIQFVNMTGKDAAAAIVSKSIDAAVLPNTSEAKIILEKTGISLLDCKDHPDWRGSNGFVVRSAYAKDNGDILKAILTGLEKAAEYAQKNPEDAKTILTKSGFSKEVFDYLYPDELGFETGVSENAIQAYKEVTAFLLENKLIKNDVDVEAWANKSYSSSDAK